MVICNRPAGVTYSPYYCIIRTMHTILIIFGAKYLYLFEVALFAGYFFVSSNQRKRTMTFLSAIYLPIAYVVAKMISLVYVDPRPFVSDHVIPLISHAPDNGFPSDHALFGGAIASIIFVYNKRLGVIAWAMALLIGASRVFAGVHHWVDILGSVLIAIGTMEVVKRYIVPRAIK